MLFKVTRFYAESDDKEVVATGLTLSEAKERCRDPEGSSRTATSPEALARTAQKGPWFEGYDEE